MILPVENHVITSPYGPRVLQGKEQFHDGIDFISRDNNNVRSILDGTIVHDMDKYIHDKRWTDKKHSAGNYLIVRHMLPDGKIYYCRYLHLEKNTVSLKDQVKEGQLIGNYGDYGYSFGPHLHFDIYDSTWKKTDITPIFQREGLIKAA